MHKLKRFRKFAPYANPTTFQYSVLTPRKRRWFETSNGKEAFHAKDIQKPTTMISRPFLMEPLCHMESMTSGKIPDTSPWVQAMTQQSLSVTNFQVWQEHLQWKYPNANTICILCDVGGSNACSHHVVKQSLMKLTSTISVNIIMFHYPPYCSKYNPIEHRMFDPISRS